MGEAARWRRVADRATGWLWYLVVLTLWIAGLTLLALATNWPRWSIYALLLLGVVLFAAIGGRSPRG